MRLVLALFIWSVSACCLGQSIHAYKSVHADGTVSYGDTRPVSASSVQEISIPRTSAAIEQQGQQRMQETDASIERIEKQREEETQARRKYQTRLAEARQEVRDAERGLVTAQQSKHFATAARIGLAEQRVRLARQRLREVESAGP